MKIQYILVTAFTACLFISMPALSRPIPILYEGDNENPSKEEAAPEAPLCKKLEGYTLEALLKKYRNLDGAEIYQNPGKTILTVKVIKEEIEFLSIFTTDPVICNKFQSKRKALYWGRSKYPSEQDAAPEAPLCEKLRGFTFDTIIKRLRLEGITEFFQNSEKTILIVKEIKDGIEFQEIITHDPNECNEFQLKRKSKPNVEPAKAIYEPKPPAFDVPDVQAAFPPASVITRSPSSPTSIGDKSSRQEESANKSSAGPSYLNKLDSWYSGLSKAQKTQVWQSSSVALIGLVCVVLILAATRRVVFYYDRTDAFWSVAIFLIPITGGIIGAFLQPAHATPDELVIPNFILMVSLGGSGLASLKSIWNSIKYNSNVFIGLIVGLLKIAMGLLMLLTVFGMFSSASDRNRSYGDRLAGIAYFSLIFGLLWKLLVNGYEVELRRLRVAQGGA